MEYYVYKLKFKTPVHIGNGTLSGSEAFIMADTLFSALCCESQSPEEIENLAERARERKLIFSDAMPFIGDEMYIPKPMTEPKNKDDGNSIMKKAYKKLKYIPISALDTYMSGKIEPLKENEKFKNFGKFDIRTMSSSLDEEKSKTGDMLPFSVGIYNFKENSGLYVIAGFAADDDKNLFDKLLKSVSFAGIGGKRSSGFGKFSCTDEKLPQNISKRINKTDKYFMTLSVSMAKDNELEKAIENSRYSLVKRSGFIYSPNYADTMRKKKDFYSFKAGSCFENAFEGDVFDVSGEGRHKVYRYAVPMFLEVN